MYITTVDRNGTGTILENTREMSSTKHQPQAKMFMASIENSQTYKECCLECHCSVSLDGLATSSHTNPANF